MNYKIEAIFIQLAVILLTAFIVSYIVRSFNQPIIIGYIIAGMIISPFILWYGASQEIINIFSEIGIAFLLFIVGLHLNPKVIKEIGVSSLMIGIGQMALTFTAVFLVATQILGHGLVESAYIGIAISFSSTIIIMKILSDKKQLDSLHGKIATGILITQDLAAIATLIVIASLSTGAPLGDIALKGFLSGGALIVILFIIGYFILPKVTKHIAKSQELLFLFSICWCFVVAALFSYFGFTIEIGALIAGIVLSISPYSTEISARIRPLRDFFLIIFFIILGFNISFANTGGIIVSTLILSLIALVLKPFVIMIFTGMYGYTKRTTFLVGTSLGQISEFSLIVITLGAAYHSQFITSEIISTITLTLVLTIVFSTYMITYSNEFYKRLGGFAKIFEKKNVKKDKSKIKKYDAILFGYNRIGYSILRSLKKIKKKYVVVDFNPDTIAALTKYRIPCVYGDVFDPDFIEELPIHKIKIAISTIPDYETNISLIEAIRKENKDAIIIARAHEIDHALEFYKRGADYVLTPHFLGGEYVAKMIKESRTDTTDYKKEKTKHIKMLEERKKLDHKHPEVEQN